GSPIRHTHTRRPSSRRRPAGGGWRDELEEGGGRGARWPGGRKGTGSVAASVDLSSAVPPKLGAVDAVRRLGLPATFLCGGGGGVARATPLEAYRTARPESMAAASAAG
ncbi:unnamed protein product, partial [Urochloa humidicola]